MISYLLLLTTLPLWLQWILWFFTSSLLTATFVGFKMLTQAPVSRHASSAHPPPLPDPLSSGLITSIWSFGFLGFVAPILTQPGRISVWSYTCHHFCPFVGSLGTMPHRLVIISATHVDALHGLFGHYATPPTMLPQGIPNFIIGTTIGHLASSFSGS